MRHATRRCASMQRVCRPKSLSPPTCRCRSMNSRFCKGARAASVTANWTCAPANRVPHGEWAAARTPSPNCGCSHAHASAPARARRPGAPARLAVPGIAETSLVCARPAHSQHARRGARVRGGQGRNLPHVAKCFGHGVAGALPCLQADGLARAVRLAVCCTTRGSVAGACVARAAAPARAGPPGRQRRRRWSRG